MSSVYVLERYAEDHNSIVAIFKYAPDVEDILNVTHLTDVDKIKDLIRNDNANIGDSLWSLTEWTLW
ncbi:hypothetical protein PQC57_gp059 [Escherichia phage vB_EcoP_WFI101126]|uniref:Uncharacterized protein n=1 Tax=Escherichia phage vB_EcoP_WFI101126 TaxID=2508203 RepID=A0A482MR65_9CAUD|nr:hypothetical protein PQC57_gp059 [Escherichia phage vB_EcoP_WFI101126]QBQ76487.1 hypothetical protein WFI101126_00059 [Escherichia phage vB_EcoP_WFI101126]